MQTRAWAKRSRQRCRAPCRLPCSTMPADDLLFSPAIVWTVLERSLGWRTSSCDAAYTRWSALGEAMRKIEWLATRSSRAHTATRKSVWTMTCEAGESPQETHALGMADPINSDKLVSSFKTYNKGKPGLCMQAPNAGAEHKRWVKPAGQARNKCGVRSDRSPSMRGRNPRR